MPLTCMFEYPILVPPVGLEPLWTCRSEENLLCTLPFPAWTYLNSTALTATVWAKCGQRPLSHSWVDATNAVMHSAIAIKLLILVDEAPQFDNRYLPPPPNADTLQLAVSP